MSFFPKSPHYIGIDAEMSTLKMAHLRKKGGGFEVVALKEGEPSKNVRAEGHFCSSIGAKEVLIRPLETPLKREKEIASSLDFQVESLLPFPADEAITVADIVEKKSQSTLLTIASVRKDHLKNHLDHLQQCGVEPDSITCHYFALASLHKILPSTEALQLLIHIGERSVVCALVEKGKLVRGHSFDLNQDLNIEIQKAVLSFEAALKPASFESILLLGNVNQELLSQISETVGKNVHFPLSFNLSISQEELTRYALPIGIALSQAEPPAPNFRKQEFAYPNPLKRMKKPLLTYAISMLCLTVATFTLGKLALNNLKKQVASQHKILLTQENKRYPLPIRASEYHKQLMQIEKEIEKKPDIFALYANVPKASDVLNWISSFPLAIEIDSIHYTMVKRPSLNQKKERYLTKVFLEFSTQTPSEARSFHEMILSPNPFVDNKQEVQWTLSRDGKYRAVFYLKDRTRYI
ncbi:MAG: hypothetical protein S4CHLAM45_10880 [Chlamydiales bacterium]|nr:hypothetical protein [Chlamydiales bacterium]MCH9619580.1 hypothetical protein [Chlamydiales bacterium]MCH9623186.1 hypothetical protein [Chlamydiales bacterium]